MLDKLSPEFRHIIIASMGAILGVIAESIPSLNLNPVLAALAGSAVTSATLYYSKLTKQYGKGK